MATWIVSEKKDNVLDYLKLRILAYYQEAVMLKNGVMPAPRMCIFYPTYACNCKCDGCDYSELNQSRRCLTLQQAEYIIYELKNLGVKSLEFCGGGEPTCYPYINQVVDKLIKNNISFGLLTNGTNITEELAEKMIKYGSYCRISVDSGTREGFKEYKHVDLFDRVMSNIKMLIEMRNKNINSKLQISYKYTIGMSNYKDIDEAIMLADELGVDSIQFKLIRNTSDEIIDEKILQEIKSSISIRQNMYPFTFTRILNNLEKSELKMKCWLSSLQLTIDAFGNVYICCYYRHRQNKHKLGNIFEKPLKEIWYSKEHWDKIVGIDIEDCNKYDCRFHYYNELMDNLVIKDTGQLNFI